MILLIRCSSKISNITPSSLRMTSSLFEPLLAHPFLIVLILMATGGVILSFSETSRAVRRHAYIPIITVLLLYFVFANLFLFIVPSPIPLRHLRELYALSAPFLALFLVRLLHHTHKTIGVILLTLLITIGVAMEFSAFGRYEKNNYIDWSYLDFLDWTEKNIPPNASILTDPFTFHLLFASLPYIQGPKQRNFIVNLNPDFDPRLAIFEGKPEQLRVALTMLCPDYIIIDTASTQQFYPVTLSILDPRLLLEFMTSVYRQQTMRSRITIFKVRPPFSCRSRISHYGISVAT